MRRAWCRSCLHVGGPLLLVMRRGASFGSPRALGCLGAAATLPPLAVGIRLRCAEALRLISRHRKKSTVNRIELVEKIATTHTVSKAEAARILETVTSAIVAAVKKGDPVQIVGFGTFKQVARAARTGFNPQAGTAIKIAAQKVPKFVPGAAFKAAVDPKAAKRKADKAAAAKPAPKKAAAKKK
ncbi:HU family DNA-binding protein [Variovorax sp. W2I14]|uniref:HU family DNA-binding protein n=1 Tax=Variovorax sp. W2I14 TaxID=3042290 RepID=UPI003D1E6498